MRAAIAVMLLAFAGASCTPNDDVTGSTGVCAARLYSPYDPKNLNQCVAACIACDHGVTTTCTTSCTLKGAR